MVTMWDPATRQAFVDRVDRLALTSAPQWGKFNVSGMLAHINDSYRMATGDLNVAARRLPLRYPPLRQLIVYVMPMPKNAPTSPELLARCAGASFDIELHAFHAQMERMGHMTSGSQLVPHPAFGNLTYKEYGVLMARHTDHHLRQFGV